MNITEDVKRFSDIQRMIGQISGKSDEDWIDDFCAMIGDYITELFLAKTELAIRREPLPQYEEWQDEFNKMCESARPKTFVADEWYRDTFKGEEE